MGSYSYKALNDQGQNTTGTIEAESLDNARFQLAQQGFIPLDVKSDQGRSGGNVEFDLADLLTDVKTADLILFTKQLRTMMRAGIPIMRVMRIMEEQTENRKLKNVIRKIGEDVSGGSSLTDAFQKHPSVFNELYCSMLRSGESSGALPEILERLTYVIEHDAKVKAEVKSALRYPMMVLGFLFAAFFILLTTVVPKFANMFERTNIDMPVPTQICMAMYNFLMDFWLILLAATIGGIVALIMYLKTEQGKYVRDTLLLNMPILGPLYVKSAMSRFASIFAILQSSGVPVLESVRILSGSIGNAAISRQFDSILDQLTSGRGLSEPMHEASYFPPMVINMVAIGEESGSLDSLLREVSEHYDYEVEYATKQLTDAIGPLLMIGLAAVVGFFALAIFMPMWAMVNMA